MCSNWSSYLKRFTISLLGKIKLITVISKFPTYPIRAVSLGREMGPHEDRAELWPGSDSNPPPLHFEHSVTKQLIL